jgi:hypothetical protein
MSSYDEEDWYSFSTQSTLYLPKEQLELEKREREQKVAKAARTPPLATVVVPPAAGLSKCNTRQNTKATAQVPAKSAR